MGRLSGYPGAGLEEPGARGSVVWGGKLGSDGSPRRGRRVQGQSRGTAWRVILQARPVTLTSARAMNRVLLSKGLEINDLGSTTSGTHRGISGASPGCLQAQSRPEVDPPRTAKNLNAPWNRRQVTRASNSDFCVAALATRMGWTAGPLAYRPGPIAERHRGFQ